HADNRGQVYTYERWQGLFRSERLGVPTKKLDFPQNDFLVDKDLNCLFTDRQGITWLARGNEALHRFEAATGQRLPTLENPELGNRRLNAIHQDPHDDNRYWLATSKGLGCLYLAEERLEWWLPTEQEIALTGDVLANLLPTPDGRIWLSAGNYYNDRLGYFDVATERFHFYDYQPGDRVRNAGGRVKQLATSPDGTVWAAASQGLLVVRQDTTAPRLITRVGDVRVGVLEAVQTDAAGDVWFSSANQIGHYRPREEVLTMTTCSPIRQFGNAVSSRLPDGRLLFGGMGGLVAVDPGKEQGGIPDFPRIVFNELRVDGQARRTDVPLANLDNLQLHPRERTLGLRFAGLFFDRTKDIEYGYRLNGGSWEELGTDRSLSFTDLRPGDYLLELRASDGQSNWSPEPRRLSISVPALWHETSLARAAFAGLVLALLFFFGRFLVRRRLERQRHEQLVALDAFKSRLFTDLTHEFRTPLTLILGPARRLSERAKAVGDETLGREARRIGQQGRRLLGLINQLLDLRKLESGQLTVEREPTELDAFFAHLTESFHSGAETAGLTLKYFGATAGAESVKESVPTVLLDRDKQETILTNLLGNALKFTPKGGSVTVQLTTTDTDWQLSVSDTGPGIAPEQQAHIFERFHRAEEGAIGGTGIGLSLARELTTLLGGTISVDSTVGKGSCFTVSFPLLPAPVEAVSPTVVGVVDPIPEPDDSAGEGPTPVVLIVEDSRPVADYLAESLAGNYRVLVAHDGAEGLAVAFAEVPDLVISDVMMPRLNGLQLTARLKADARTSHLPVLLLTAKTAEEHRLEGLDRGADAYLSKPFNERELHLRLRNLLALRDRTAARLREELLATTSPPTLSAAPAEAAWLTQLREYIHARLDDPGLSGKDLEREVGMSRSQLHRKLQSVLGLSPTRLINQLRLEKAAEMLRAEEQTVSEVAYACGFKDPGYFSRKFKERFGTSPSSFPGP
ncbi:MAG: ATP-binding protein, partial [Bacteroidota bacterium]